MFIISKVYMNNSMLYFNTIKNEWTIMCSIMARWSKSVLIQAWIIQDRKYICL